jgi:aryl-alcohol dehydrogenase-like predicted oxidoreductase
MDYRNLGAAGVKVSTLCLGAMTFGEADEHSMMHRVSADEETSHRILDRALDGGINFVDTADVYGQDGLSERVIGTWFARHGRRDDVVLATKFRFTTGRGANKSGASRYRIVRCVEDSLRRLRTDRIDLYQIHMQDITVAEDETLRALDDLVRAGKVLYLGCSNYAAYRLVDSLWTSRSQHLERFVTLQAQYNLVVRDIEREHVPLCRDHQVGILPWSPLAGGFLTGKYRRNQGPPTASRFEKWGDRLGRFDTERNWRIIDTLVAVAHEVDASPSQVALAWLMARPQVSSVVFGVRSVAQLDDNLRAADIKLSTDQNRRLDTASGFELGYPYEFIHQIQQEW